MTAPIHIFIVDDDEAVRDGLTMVLKQAGFSCSAFESAECFLKNHAQQAHSCLLLDVHLPGLNGHELQAELNRRHIRVPIIFLSAYGTIPMTVRAIKAGAADFLTKPVASQDLIARINEVMLKEAALNKQSTEELAFCRSLDSLTQREANILPMVMTGLSNKEIAQKLGISYRTVEIHRTRILQKTGVANFLELARLCETYQVTIKPHNEVT